MLKPSISQLEILTRMFFVSSGLKIAAAFVAASIAIPCKADNLGVARAQWLNRDYIAYFTGNLPSTFSPIRYFLSLEDPNKLVIGEVATLNYSQELKLDEKKGKYHLLKTEPLLPQISQVIRYPMTLIVVNQSSVILDKTHFQLSGLLDSLFYYPGNDLGVRWDGIYPVFKLWAPTAQSVKLLLYEKSKDSEPVQQIAMNYEKGVWDIRGINEWKNKFYLYEVTVFSPYTGKIETFRVVDPYSFSVGVNFQKSQIVNMNDPQLKPQGWDSFRKPELRSLQDVVIYEVHLRDLTAGDPEIGEMFRGTFSGLVQNNARSFQHLQKLAFSGLTHIHFLPINDFSSVNEDRSFWKNLQVYQNYPPHSADPQGELSKIKDEDNYNWGYDPVNYFVPDGSYAQDPDGFSRIVELRFMVQKLNEIGLRVIQDVVFNHTYENRNGPFSVLDKIVPLYYYRLDEWGSTYNSTCCADTATENKMMEKLMVDAVLFWARNYKIDGFRFDLMNLHTRENMRNLRDSIRALTPAKDGVDGSKIYLYGEAWNFGSLEAARPGQSMHQLNTPGMGIGTFNDRMRDAIRGGSTDSKEKSDQGFATGLFYDFNKEPANRDTPGNMGQQYEKLQVMGDVIRIGLAGNLRDYFFEDFKKNSIRSGNHYFRGAPTGYAASPLETVNYVSSHDGYTLWDAIQAKMPFYTQGRIPGTATDLERVRAHRISLALVILSQGIPFIEGGSDLLRSKSGDVDSYNSGDWFNKIDFSYRNNNWGVGLPPKWKNEADWSFWTPRLKDASLTVRNTLITKTATYVQGLLKVRKSSPLFHLPSTEEIQKRVTFPKDEITGESLPGLIAMKLSDENSFQRMDRNNNSILIFFNASNTEQFFKFRYYINKNIHLTPFISEEIDNEIVNAVFDEQAGTFKIPARTTLIYEESR